MAAASIIANGLRRKCNQPLTQPPNGSMDFIRLAALAQPRFKANPYPLYARLRVESPVCRTRFLGWRAWLVTRYNDVLSLLKDERLTKDKQPAASWIHFVS